jgi:hypothetical protein
MFRSLPVLAMLLMVIACQQNASQESANTTTEQSAEELSLERDKVQSSAVASYEEKVDDALNDWKFSAKLFETKERFRYLLEMEYQEMSATDTIKFPNFGMEPQPKIQKGENKHECIIGFLDREGKFREYVKVFVDDDQLRLKTLKHYSIVEKK